MFPPSLIGLILSSIVQKIMYTKHDARLIQNRFLNASPVLKSKNEYCCTPVAIKYTQQNNPYRMVMYVMNFQLSFFKIQFVQIALIKQAAPGTECTSSK